jgi:hypothetical protein
VFDTSWPSQLVWQDAACDSKSCNAVNIVAMLFGLFLPVMYILGALQVDPDLGLWIYSQIWAKSSKVELTAREAGKGIPGQRQQLKRMFE